ncbi:xylosyltransferase [Phtheirospermum japonicum]|uniref:Xylosyltransferase n=1 Tax=Phtheirospermum japonicum TaxID=374723 RepID=A0A830AXC4_9LAMI|nr:xylosyltransferase [Phtheirospermum japonicum]
MHDHKLFPMGNYLNLEKKWALVLTSLVCIFLLATSFNMGLLSSLNTINSIFSMFPNKVLANEKEANADQVPPPPAPPPVPKFAYLISGSRGDLDKLWRTLHAVYHPWNYYVVHLDLESPVDERFELGSRVENHPLFSKVGNVFVNNRSNMVTYRGPTMVSNTLHACALLLKRYKDWDWFINLSASDYPLVTQDDLLFTFSDLKRELNFIEHTSHLGWKAGQRAMPLIVDPGLYQTTKADIFWVTPNRHLPTAFKLFTAAENTHFKPNFKMGWASSGQNSFGSPSWRPEPGP